MTSDSPADDRFMHGLALGLLHKHEEAVERPDAGSPDLAQGAIDTLMAAAMASRHVLVWHVGTEPSPAQISAFAREFPDWSRIDAECTRRIGAAQSAGSAAAHPMSDADLARACHRFLQAYERRHLGNTDASAESSACEPPRVLRARLAAGRKRH